MIFVHLPVGMLDLEDIQEGVFIPPERKGLLRSYWKLSNSFSLTISTYRFSNSRSASQLLL